MAAETIGSDARIDRCLPLVRALQISPRASFAELAAALELSEPTVARRYRWATANGLLRVVGVLDTRRLGQSQWMVRVRPRPSEVARTAAALAARDEVRWVTIDNGGFGITCAVLARTAEQRTALLADRLAEARDVVDLHAVEILHQYTGGRAHYWSTFEGVLSLEQERLLGAAGAPFAESTGEGRLAPVTIDDLDEHLLRLLADDGRSAWSELSEEVGVPVGRVRRRVDRMVAGGLLDFDVELAAQPIGFHARANLWLRVAPANMDRAARALSALPQVVFAAAVSGNANLLVIAHCRSTEELFDLTTRRLGEIADAQLLDVSSVTEQVKQAGTVLAHERLRR